MAMRTAAACVQLCCICLTAAVWLVGALPLVQDRPGRTVNSNELVDGESAGFLQFDKQDIDASESKWLQSARGRRQPMRRTVKRRIYGRDDRNCAKKDPESLPYSAIGYFEHAKCAGFLIAPNIVMTTANCLYDASQRTFRNTNFDFSRGGSSGPEDAEVMPWKSLYLPYAYIHTPWKENDYGFVVTSKSVNSSQHLEVAAVNITTHLPLTMPSSYSRLQKEHTGCSVQCNATLYQHSWYEWNEHNRHLFCYHCDTDSDSGGSPLLYGTSNRLVVGVNVGYFASGFRGSCNVGTRLTKDRVEDIRDRVIGKPN